MAIDAKIDNTAPQVADGFDNRSPPIITITPPTLAPRSLDDNAGPQAPQAEGMALDNESNDAEIVRAGDCACTTGSAKPISIPPAPQPAMGVFEPHCAWAHTPSLLPALCGHLKLLHPATPDPVIAFVAQRLLSADRPYGFSGSWHPVQACEMKLCGLEKDAAKGVERKSDTEGRQVDLRVERMYGAARDSWEVLVHRRDAGTATATRSSI